MMKAATKGTLMGAVFGAVLWVGTGTWQLFAVALAGAACTWMFSRPSNSQPSRRVRELVRVEIRMEEMRKLDRESSMARLKLLAELEGKLGKRHLDEEPFFCGKGCDGSVRCPCMGD